jgi:hypothetical protein
MLNKMKTIPIDEAIKRECDNEDFSMLSLSDLRLAYDLYTIALETLDRLLLDESANSSGISTKRKVIQHLRNAVGRETLRRI